MGDVEEGGAADLDDLEEGECSDDDQDELPIQPQEEEIPMQTEEEITTLDDDHIILQTQISVIEEEVEVDNNVEKLDNGKERKNSSGDKERDKERKHKKHKRHRSRSREKERDREKKHKKHKKREREEEYDPDDEESKKRFMLKRLRALEGNMGLVRSEDEYETQEPQVLDKKQPPSQRVCKLYMEGRCPRETKDCIFSHDVEVPKVWELCKFYVYDRCAKRDKCLYLHKEFPCKYFHLGLDCGNDAATCKFSHSPLNFKTRTLLLKHVEGAPKELLGDFPRIMKHDAITAIKKAEAMRNNWPDEGWLDSDGNEFDIENIIRNSTVGFPGGGGGNMNVTPFMQKQMLTMMSMLKKNIEQMNEKPADLMSIKLDEDAVKAKLQNQGSLPADEVDSVLMNDSSGQLIKDSVDDNKQQNTAGDSGDETPDVTPPVSPSSKLDIDIAQSGNEEGEVSSSVDQFYPPDLRNFKEFKDSDYRDDTKENRNRYNSGEHNSYHEMTSGGGSPRKSKWSPMDQGWSPNNQAWSQSPNSQPWGNSPRDQTWSQKVTERRNSNDNKADEAGGSKISRQDPRKTDPRKEKRARREQEEQRAREHERLEKEKEQRMLDIDLGSVFDDLDLPPLSVSDHHPLPPLTVSDHSPSPNPKHSYGLPFKPYEYNVASHIDASLNSHDPIAWVLRPVDVDIRDYSSIRHGMTQSQIELDPRLRRYTQGGKKIVVEPPLPSHQMSPMALLSPTGSSSSSDKFMEVQLLNPSLSSPAAINTPTPPKTVKMDPRLNKARART